MTGVPSCAAGVPIFAVLPPEGLNELGEAMFHRHFVRGEVVMAAGQPVTHLVVLARGRLNVVRTSAGGREQLLRALGPGEFLGEMGLFVPTVQEGDLVAAEESDCCLVPRQAMQAVLQRHPGVALRLVEALAQRLSEAEQLIGDLGLRDVGGRLAAELLRLAAGAAENNPDSPRAVAEGLNPAGKTSNRTGPVPTAGGIRVQVPMPWAELAVKLGTTPESLSRRLKALGEQGIISQAGARMVIIHDTTKLRRLAEA
jgi:CRP/FNR family transcriptional regulator, anaerobic regulatory protein